MSGVTRHISSATVYELLMHLSYEAAAGGDSEERLRRLAAVFAAPRVHLPEPLAEALEALCKPLVYMVLNVPANRSSHNERVFVAVVDPQAAVPPPRSLPLYDTSSDRTGILFFDRPGAQCANGPVEERWRREWTEYVSHTRDLQQRQIFTWNQYLLHGCRRPTALGLAWRGPAARAYMTLDETLARAAEIPYPIDPQDEWWRNIAAMAPLAANHEARALKLESRLRAMEPLSSMTDLMRSAVFSAHHLVRSYATWGGDGFLSLPILVGRTERDVAVSVLSLCTRPNLSDDDVLTWHAIASTCFSSVAASELVEIGRLSERVSVLEGTGHALKGVAEITAWEQVAHKLRHAIADEPADLKGLLQLAAGSLELVALVQGLGNLVRAAGVLGGGHAGKLRSWHDPEEHSLWTNAQTASVLEAYVELVYELGRVVCFGTARESLTIEVHGHQHLARTWQWAHDCVASKSFRPRSLRVPPFAKGSDAIFVVFAALIEPMRNASHAMNRSREMSGEPLRIRIVSRLPEQLVIEIGNRAETCLRGLPPGIRDTQRLIQAIGLASYGDPYIEHGSASVMWLPVVVNPLSLAAKLAAEAPSTSHWTN